MSTDSGVAFLVTVSGKTIYHAGDLNWWRWEGEPEEFNRFQEETYKQQINLLKGRKIDLSFVVMDPRQEQDRFLGMDYFLEQVTTGYVCPMHLWKHYELIEEDLDRLESDELRERILRVGKENQVLTI